MQSLNLFHKVSFIKNNLAFQNLLTVHIDLQQVYRAIFQGKYRSFEYESIFADIAYACVKHQNWLNSQAFIELLADYLAKNYEMPFHSFLEFSKRATSSFQSVLGLKPLNSSQIDTKFFEYAIYHFIESDSLEQFYVEFGLGTTVAKIINQLFETSYSQSAIDYHYAPETLSSVESGLQEIIDNLSEFLFPQSSFKLYFILLRSSAFQRPSLSKPFLQKLLDILLLVGEQKEISHKELISYINSDQEIGISVQPQVLVEELLNLELIFPVKKSKSSTIYQLTDLSYNLTAPCFVEWYKPNEDFKEEFPRFNKHYQLAFLDTFSNIQSVMIKDILLKNIDRLHEDVICKAIKKFPSLATDREIFDLAQVKLLNSKLKWEAKKYATVLLSLSMRKDAFAVINKYFSKQGIKNSLYDRAILSLLNNEIQLDSFVVSLISNERVTV